MSAMETKQQAGQTSISMLSSQQTSEMIKKIPNWALKEKEIEREFKFKDFREAVAFVNKVADAAEKANHHPDIFISYNKVKLICSTHKVGGLSQKDFSLAEQIDSLI